jgi:hypothetical protein
MMRFSPTAPCLLMAVLLCSSCAGTPHKPWRPAELAYKRAPAHEKASYQSLPADVQMTVRDSTEDMVALIRHTFPQLTEPRAYISIDREDLVVANDLYFRRATFSYQDNDTWTIHGPCSQPIHIWFWPSGKVADIYVGSMDCPI